MQEKEQVTDAKFTIADYGVGDITFYIQGGNSVTLKSDGRVEYDGYTPEEAAQTFWDAVVTVLPKQPWITAKTKPLQEKLDKVTEAMRMLIAEVVYSCDRDEDWASGALNRARATLKEIAEDPAWKP